MRKSEKVTKKKHAPRASAEFQSEAVRMVANGGKITQIAKNLNINEHTLGTWVRKARALEKKGSMRNSSGESLLDLEAENKRLAKENDYLKRANKVLKIASAFFTQDQLENDMRNLKK